MDYASLYRLAFANYATRALWNKHQLDAPGPDDALVVAQALRIEGDRDARILAEQIERACQPLAKIQSDILRVLASHRDPESYVAPATLLIATEPRYSSDIDILNDREDRVASAAMNDAQESQRAGYEVTWLRRLPLLYAAGVTRAGSSNCLEWLADSDFRFSGDAGRSSWLRTASGRLGAEQGNGCGGPPRSARLGESPDCA